MSEGKPVSAPYGPATVSIRRFLVRLASLDPMARDAIVTRFAELADSRAYTVADAALAETIERSGRTDAQDALAGPLLQLVRPREPSHLAAGDHGPDVALDALAEPALAALLALLVRDLLPSVHFRTLYSPFDESIPAGVLD